ncbi:hypothetical protein CAOG_01247 [Capsaspora owczarzaki ATCC 30864]|uniref:Uncharacterized protein n=1 Tax=Capsaspora owczarzaki (strain ATCC 30864) TaxID=595528 RepID=A0A0D2U3N2_CAPO3|nr:hypothetical protein CAOG_01247 [Capsaspora owczarzaki ATCC 30864]KJE89826.1 hypothetical protein CAOG_001247 [Capsaspora owczarzaki ATCC 30864]|eukprot:XP_004349767.1 hypothetical protein CAOG_01247 [Capsaspora owczarzaki ATCC 30864]
MVLTLGDVIDGNSLLKDTLALPEDNPLRKWQVTDVVLIDKDPFQRAVLAELPPDRAATQRRLAALSLLQRLLEQEVGAPRTLIAQPREFDTRFMGVVNGVLALKDGAVVSTCYGKSKFSDALTTMDGLKTYLQDRLGDLSLLQVTTLDLSGNELLNEDLPYVCDVVNALQCPVVKLRSNRFGMGQPSTELNSPVHYLASMAASAYVRFVDIVGNYVVGVEWAPAYQRFANPTTWHKLVYIPLVWLKGHDWTKPDICGQYVTAAKDCHEDFYWANLSDPVFSRSDPLPALN